MMKFLVWTGAAVGAFYAVRKIRWRGVKKGYTRAVHLVDDARDGLSERGKRGLAQAERVVDNVRGTLRDSLETAEDVLRATRKAI